MPLPTLPFRGLGRTGADGGGDGVRRASRGSFLKCRHGFEENLNTERRSVIKKNQENIINNLKLKRQGRTKIVTRNVAPKCACEDGVLISVAYERKFWLEIDESWRQ